MTPSLRKFALTTHITLSVGWIGAVLAYLVLVVAAMATKDAQTLRAAWIAIELIGWYLIVPLAITSLFTGLVMALGTQFRHYWVLISLALTIVATVVLLQHMQTITFFARVAAQANRADLGGLRSALRGEFLHAGVGLLVLFVIEALNVYKPQGVTGYGRRSGASPVASPSRVSDHSGLRPGQGSSSRTPRWVQVVGIHALGLALLFLLMHLTGGGLRQH